MNAFVWCIASAAAAGFLLPGASGRVERRLAAVVPTPREDAADQRLPSAGREVLKRRFVAALAGVACALLMGGVPGLLFGVGAAVACDRILGRLEPAAVRRRKVRIAADLPIAVELLGACLRGGSSWPTAVDAVAAAVGGPLGAELGEVAALVRLGADPSAAWLTLAADPVLAPLARTVARAAESGASLAPALGRLAQDQRRAARAAALTRARSAGIRAVAPLGLCFLPAFVLLGIVPAIAGIATTLQLP
jgi:Flp pilus assembly protein TadB